MIVTKSQTTIVSDLRSVLCNLYYKGIIELLRDVKEPLSVTDIYCRLRLEQSVVSQRLNLLRRMKIVKVEQLGKFKMYTLNQEKIDKYMLVIRTLESITKDNDVQDVEIQWV